MADMEELLDAFRKLDYVKEHQAEQTFMQLSGYPHYENVCSNLLCFFFNTEEAHFFNDLFIRSLLECSPQTLYTNEHKTEYIDRECKTDKNNRIDIVIETETLIIGIENKIYSEVYNDLDDYEAYIKKRAMESDKDPVYILLSLKSNAGVTDITGFCNVTYSVFIEHLKQNLGQYLLAADTKWIVFFNDFIKTLEGLQGEIKMDIKKEVLDFFYDNWDGIIEMLDA